MTNGSAERGIATKIFAPALADARLALETVRFVAVIVDALTDGNVTFYGSRSFVRVPGTTNTLFLPASTLVEVAAP